MLHKISLYLCLALMSLFVYAEEIPTRVGYAYDKQTNELIYTENHFEKFNDNLIAKSKVIYKDAKSSVIGNKTVDFSKNNFMPEFNLRNDLTGHVEATRFIENKYQVTFSKLENEAKKEALLKFPENGISDAGFDNFIIKHWTELIEGKVYVREFLIPSMMDFIKFRIYQDGIVDNDNKLLRVINIEPDSFFIRAFAGTTRLYYEKSRPALRKFDGVSNMRDSKGNNLKVTIRYEETQNLALN